MKNKVEEGYVMNIRKNNLNEYVGGLLLSGEDKDYDLIELEDKDMSFLEGMHSIDERLSKGNCFSLSYDPQKELFSSKIRQKKESQEDVVWQTIVKTEDRDFYKSINDLDKEINNVISKEEKICKKI